MTEKLIKMVRVLAPDDTGASTADVHPSQVDDCLATGWRLANENPIAIASDDDPVPMSVDDAAEAVARGRRKK